MKIGLWQGLPFGLLMCFIFGTLFFYPPFEVPKRATANGGFYIERMSHLPKEEGIWRFNHIVNGFNQMGYFICDKDGKCTTMFHHP